MDCTPPGSSVRWISQARILEWVVISSSRISSRPRDRTCVSPVFPALAGGFFFLPLSHLLLLLLSHFSHVRLCATLETAAHQASPSLEFSRQEHGVGCRCLLQCMTVKSESEVAQSCPTLSDLMDCSLPGFSVHGIFQARVLEWGAIAFSFRATWEALFTL